MTLTPDQIVARLARREGWEPADDGCGGYQKKHPEHDGWTSTSFRKDFAYLTSRDAISGVLEKLTVDEINQLRTLLWDRWDEVGSASDFEVWMLRIPPATLAAFVAEAIGETK